MQAEKDNWPKRVHDQLADKYRQGDFNILPAKSLAPDKKRGDAHEGE